MNKQEYMSELKSALKAFDDDLQSEIIEDYENHFKDGLANGKTEEQIVSELGSIDDLIDELKDLSSSEKSQNSSNKSGKADKAKSKDESEGFAKSIAATIGSIAASITNGTEKLIDGVTSSSFETTFNEFSEKVTNKSVEFAKDVKNSFESTRNNSEKKAEKNADNNTATHNTDNEEDCNVVQDTYTEDIPDGNVHNMVLETHCGNVILNRSNDNTFHIDYNNYGSPSQQLAYKFDFYEKNGTAYVSVKKQPGVTNFFKALICPRIVIKVQVPTDFNNIKVHSYAGNIELNDINATDLDLTTMAGNVSMSNCHVENVLAKSMAGNVYFDREEAKSVTCKTNAGLINVNGNIKEAKLTSNSGDLIVRGSCFESLITSATAGNTTIELDHINGFEADATSSAGNISLFYNEEKVLDGKSGSCVMGDGSVKIKSRATAGNISITGNN